MENAQGRRKNSASQQHKRDTASASFGDTARNGPRERNGGRNETEVLRMKQRKKDQEDLFLRSLGKVRGGDS